MRYRHMYWLMCILWLVVSICYYGAAEDRDEWKVSTNIAIREFHKQDSIARARQDTINILKFKLHTLQSLKNEVGN